MGSYVFIIIIILKLKYMRVHIIVEMKLFRSWLDSLKPYKKAFFSSIVKSFQPTVFQLKISRLVFKYVAVS